MNKRENVQTSALEQSDNNSTFYQAAQSTYNTTSSLRPGRGGGPRGWMPAYAAREGNGEEEV